MLIFLEIRHMKSLSPNLKNTILLVIISYRFMLRFLDVIHMGDHFSNYDWSALFLFILLIFVYLRNGFSFVKNSNSYTALHLLYGSLLGEKIILGLWIPKALILSEWIWIAVGIIGVLIYHIQAPPAKEISLPQKLENT